MRHLISLPQAYGIFFINPSAIISISSPMIFPNENDNPFVGFQLIIQLRSEPIVVRRKIKEEELSSFELPGDKPGDKYFFKLIQAKLNTMEVWEKEHINTVGIEDWEKYFPYSICYANVRNEIISFGDCLE